jgi:hypothetical protein
MGLHASITVHRNVNIDVRSVYYSYNGQDFIYDVEFEVLAAMAVESSVFGL